MSDISILDTCEPEEIHEELSAFADKYARRTGDYEKATLMLAAAAWLEHFCEEHRA